MGAGDLLMSFLGVVILSFGFRIWGQRRLMARHAPEILGATAASASFSLFATAAVARAVGLAPGAMINLEMLAAFIDMYQYVSILNTLPDVC